MGHRGCRQDANSGRAGFYVVFLPPPGQEDSKSKGLAAEKAPGVLSGKNAGSGSHFHFLKFITGSQNFQIKVKLLHLAQGALE